LAEREAGQVLATRPEPGERIDLMRARDVADIKVQNPEGENIGDITDIAIDRDGGCIAYAVLAYGGILGFGEKHFAIPWEAVRVRSREKIAIVDTDKKTLDNASGFTRDKMPREGDWSVIRTPPRPTAAKERPAAEGERPPPKEEKPAAPAEPAPRTVESYTPVPPPVQTVAGGWGEKAMKPRTEEQPARAAGAVVEEVRREEPARAEAKATEVRHEEPARTETETVEVRRETPAGAEREQPVTTPGPTPGHVSAADLQVYLRGIDYPAGRQDLIAHAQKNNAPEGVIAVLEGFGDRTYRSAAEVSEEFGREARHETPAGAETVVEERPETRARAPSRAHLSAADLQVYLRGIDYPAGRQDLVMHAQKNNAPESVVDVIEQFGDRTYRSAAEVSEEFGRETRGEKTRHEPPARTETVAEERPETRVKAPAHLSAADLQVYLKGMDYPAEKQDLVARAKGNNAPEGVIEVFEGFGDRTYSSPAEVSEEFGSKTRGERRETVAEERPEARTRPPSRISAADFQVYLKGMDYPAGRQDLVARARKNNAPESVIDVIEQFGDRTYRSAAEVSEEFGKVR